MSLITAEALHVVLDDQPILRDLSFAVARGEWVGLLGPNGSGKTTLLRTISGVLPHRGRLAFDGRPVRDWKAAALARRLAFVRQSTSLAFDFQVLELVLLGRAPHKRWLAPDTAADRAHARAALAEVEMEAFAERSVLSLSGGELQRVLLAQALVQDTDVLLLDEPTAHLDVHHQYELMHRVHSLVAGGRTVVAVFHDLELAARYAHRLLVLRDGRLVADGAPADVLTPSLLADVFRMDARCAPGPDGALRIDYLDPLPPARPLTA